MNSGEESVPAGPEIGHDRYVGAIGLLRRAAALLAFVRGMLRADGDLLRADVVEFSGKLEAGVDKLIAHLAAAELRGPVVECPAGCGRLTVWRREPAREAWWVMCYMCRLVALVSAAGTILQVVPPTAVSPATVSAAMENAAALEPAARSAPHEDRPEQAPTPDPKGEA